jgi:hypothetical protein
VLGSKFLTGNWEKETGKLPAYFYQLLEKFLSYPSRGACDQTWLHKKSGHVAIMRTNSLR